MAESGVVLRVADVMESEGEERKVTRFANIAG